MGKKRKFQRLTFEKGEVLLEEGKKDDVAYLIVEGQVEIRTGTRGENPRTVACVGKGEMIGELALFDNHPHVATAIAMEKTTVNSISGDEFRSRVESMDPIIKGVVNMLVHRFRQLTADLVRKKENVNWSEWRRN